MINIVIYRLKSFKKCLEVIIDMKKLAARINLILILVFFAGGYYVSVNQIEPLSGLIKQLQEFVYLVTSVEAYACVYYVSLLILLFSVFISLYAAFEGVSKKEVALQKEIKLLKEDAEDFENKKVEYFTEIKKLNLRIQELQISLEQKVSADKYEKLQAEAEENANALEGAKAKSDELTDKIKKLSQKIEDLNSEKAKLTEQERDLSNKLKDSQAKLASANANLKGGKDTVPPAAYQILYLLQKEGRLIDMLHENIGDYDDETLGGAFRKLHEDLQELIKERFILEPVLNEEEGNTITLDSIDPDSVKVSGKVPAEGPFTGELIHKGWRLKECKLPEMVDGWKGDVIAQAEIEI
jgi:cell division protein FtsB